jgi:3D (Asp-Asp-Asp) domain-containing protein
MILALMVSAATLESLAVMGHTAPPAPPEVYEITAYCSCERCTGPSSPARGGHGLTASGRRPRPNHTVAVDPDLIPLGSRVKIEGFGHSFRAEDTGSAIKGRRIDIYMHDHQVAKRFARRRRVVTHVR